MGNFSSDTFDKLKHYVGVRLQQGVPLVDADWNEQEDIRRYELQAFLKWFVGNGVPEGNDGFCILPVTDGTANDFIIKGGDDKGAGRCLVEGWDVINERDRRYTKQPLYKYKKYLTDEWDVDSLNKLEPPKKENTTRTDTVYLDVWEREVNAFEDKDLFNRDIGVGVETCVRLKREWVVRVAQGTRETKLDAPPTGHVYYPLATLERGANEAAIDQIKDLRRTGVAVSPEEITIKDGNVGIGTLTPQNKLQLGGGDIAIGDNQHRAGKIRLWQEPNNKDDCVSHAIGTEAHYNIYGAGKEYANSIGHRFYRGGEELIAQIGVGGTGNPANRLNSYFAGNVGIGTLSPSNKLTISNGDLMIEGGDLRINGREARSLKIVSSGSGAGIDLVAIKKDAPDFKDHPYIDFAHGTLGSPDYGIRIYAPTNDQLRIDGGNVGIGTTPTKYTLDVNGDCYISEGLKTRHSDYAEYFESVDGSEIPVGTSVTLTKDAKIGPAKKGDVPIGIITTNSAIVGNSYKEWPKKYLRDEFGNPIMEEYKEEVMIPKKEKIKKERQKVEKKTITEEVTRTEIVLEKGKYIQKEISESIAREIEEPLFEEVDVYDATGKKVIGKHKVPVMETYEKEIDVLDENGEPQLPLCKDQPVAPTWIKIKDISKEVELWLVR
jgi:6-pyruvoyl-tetrahydropterin synthase